MRRLIVMIVVVVVCGCNWSNSDLGNSYYYLDSIEAVDIGYPDGAIIYKSKNKNVFQDIKISKEVIQVVYNDSFILAKQVVKNTIPDTNYFVINKKTDRVYGPLNLDSLGNLRKAQKIGIEF